MSTVFDEHANLSYALVTVPPVPPLAGLTLTVDDPSSFPTAPFNALVWPPSVCAYQSNAEIVRVTGISGNVFTILRAQEGTTAKAIAAGWQIANAVTVKVLTDIEDAVNTIETTGVFDGDAAGGALAGTYPNPDLNPALAGAGLSFLLNVLSVNVDGVTIGINGSSNELEVLAGGILTDAVILHPLTSARNVINPAPDVIPLSIFGSAGQTQDLFDIGIEPSLPAQRVVPGKNAGAGALAVGIGAGSFDPAAYGGYGGSTLVISQATDGTWDPDGGPDIVTPSNGYTQMWLDANFVPAVNGNGESIQQGSSARFSGNKTGADLVGIYQEVYFEGTKAAGSGNQLSLGVAAFQGYAVSDTPSTGDLFGIYGGAFVAIANGSGAVGEIIGLSAGGTVGNVPAAAKIATVDAFTASLRSLGRTVGTGAGVHVRAPFGGANFDHTYGLLLDSQAAGSADAWAIYSAGGKSRLDSGVATAIPLTLRGFAAQSANLFVTEDSAGNDLVAITSAGRIVFGTSADTNLYRSAADVLKTDDSFLVGATLEQDGTLLGLLGAAPVVQQAASTISALWTALKNYGLLTAGSTAPVVGAGTVTSVTATDASIVVTGTATDPTIATGALNAIATAHPPVAAVAMNAQKITGLANGSAASDAAAFGQIPTSLPPSGAAGGALTGTYPNPTLSDTTAAPDRLFLVRYVCKR